MEPKVGLGRRTYRRFHGLRRLTRPSVGVTIAALVVLAFAPVSCQLLGGRKPVFGGPSLGRAPSGITRRQVRVLLAENVASAAIGIGSAYDVCDAITAKAVQRCPGLPEAAVTATANGFRIGGKTYVGTAIDLAPAADGALRVNGSGYHGVVRLILRPSNTFHVINVVGLESYLAGVINGEMPANWPNEALKAQAVAARTYTLYQMMAKTAGDAYDVRPDERSQMYLGLGSETARSREIVAATSGIILVYQDRLFCTYYSSTCGGHTQNGRDVFPDGGIPPLAGVKCTYCSASKYTNWDVTVSFGDLTTKLNAALAPRGRSVGAVVGVQVLRRAVSGHVAQIRVIGSSGTADLSGVAFREAVGTHLLPSMNMQPALATGGIRFTGHGFGHGVGLCQWGARGAAEAGLDFLHILNYYYPRSTPVRLS